MVSRSSSTALEVYLGERYARVIAFVKELHETSMDPRDMGCFCMLIRDIGSEIIVSISQPPSSGASSVLMYEIVGKAVESVVNHWGSIALP